MNVNIQKNRKLSRIVIAASDKHFITIPDSFCGKSLNDYKYKNSKGKVKQLTLSDRIIFGLIYAFQRQGLPFHMGLRKIAEIVGISYPNASFAIKRLNATHLIVIKNKYCNGTKIIKKRNLALNIKLMSKYLVKANKLRGVKYLNQGVKKFNHQGVKYFNHPVKNLNHPRLKNLTYKNINQSNNQIKDNKSYLSSISSFSNEKAENDDDDDRRQKISSNRNKEKSNSKEQTKAALSPIGFQKNSVSSSDTSENLNGTENKKRNFAEKKKILKKSKNKKFAKKIRNKLENQFPNLEGNLEFNIQKIIHCNSAHNGSYKNIIHALDKSYENTKGDVHSINYLCKAIVTCAENDALLSKYKNSTKNYDTDDISINNRNSSTNSQSNNDSSTTDTEVPDDIANYYPTNDQSKRPWWDRYKIRRGSGGLPDYRPGASFWLADTKKGWGIHLKMDKILHGNDSGAQGSLARTAEMIVETRTRLQGHLTKFDIKAAALDEISRNVRARDTHFSKRSDRGLAPYQPLGDGVAPWHLTDTEFDEGRLLLSRIGDTFSDDEFHKAVKWVKKAEAW